MFEKTTRSNALHSPGIESMLYEETVVYCMAVFMEVIETYSNSI